jgi:hypothetical protein
MRQEESIARKHVCQRHTKLASRQPAHKVTELIPFFNYGSRFALALCGISGLERYKKAKTDENKKGRALHKLKTGQHFHPNLKIILQSIAYKS